MEKSVTASLMHFLLLFPKMLGLKIPLLRSVLVWLWFCLQLFLPTVGTVWSSFHMVSNYCSFNWSIWELNLYTRWFSEKTALVSPLPPSTWPSSKRTGESWEGVHHFNKIHAQAQYSVLSVVLYCRYTQVVWSTSSNGTVSYVQTLGPMSERCITWQETVDSGRQLGRIREDIPGQNKSQCARWHMV